MSSPGTAVPGFTVGQCVARRFVVERVLHAAEGTAVVVARDRLEDDEECAVKIAFAREGDRSHFPRLEGEYRILADLRHPGIPRVIDFGFDTDLDAAYMAREFVPGEVLAEAGELLPTHALALFQDVLRTLTYLHDRQILHCDVKPANVVRDDRRARTVLIDFDLARRFGGATGRGTAPFFAPEMLGLGGPVDARADLYSLAATFSTLVGGRIASLEDGGSIELPASDHPFIALLGELLARDPAGRPADGRAVFARLRELGFEAPDETLPTARARFRHPPYVPREALEARILAEIPAVRGRSGPCPVVALKGPFGVGKTRLLQRLGVAWRCVGTRVFQARARDGGGRTLGPVRNLVRRLSRLDSDAGIETAPGGDRLGLFDRLGLRLLKLGRAQRTVLVFEDVDRFDRASRDFLLHFLRQVSDESGPSPESGLLKVVVTFDPGALQDDPLRAWLEAESDGGAAVVLSVEPLTEAESVRFVLQILPSRAADGDWIRRLVEAAGGNPLALREWVAASVEDHAPGLPERSGNPESVGALVRRRLERLPEEQRALLDLVSLFPAGAPRSALAALREPSPVDEPLAALVMREDLAVQGGRYFLTGALRLEVLSGIETDLTRSEHGRIADALDRIGGAPEEVAYHLLRAGRQEAGLRITYDVLPGLRDSGMEEETVRLLREVRDSAAAFPWARRWAVLTLVDLWLSRGQVAPARSALREFPPEARATHPDVAVRIARVAYREGDLVEARGAFDRLLALERELSDDDRADFLIELAEILHGLGHPSDARETLDRTTPLVDAWIPHREIADADVPVEAVSAPQLEWPGERAPQLARYLLARGDAERSVGRPAAAIRCHLAALRFVTKLQDRHGIGRASHALGTVYMAAGRLDLAEHWFLRALPIRREVGDLVGVADTANNLGVLMRKGKRAAEAIEHFSLSLRLRRQVGHVAGEGYAYLNIANVYYERRELDAAARYLQRSLLVARRLRDARSQAQVLNNLGAVAHLRFRIEEAIRCYEEAEVLFRVVGDVHGAMARWLNLADLRILVGHFSEAARMLDVVERLNRSRDHQDVAARLLLLRGRWMRSCGDPGRADEMLRGAEALAADHAELREEIRIELAFARLDAGRDAEALEIARAVAEGPIAVESLPLVAIIRGRAALRADEDTARRACAGLLDAARFAAGGRMAGLQFQASRTLAKLYRELNERPRALGAFLDAFEALEAVSRSFTDADLLDSWIRTPPVSEFAIELERFLAEVSRGRPEEALGRSHEVLRRLKDALFDAERSIGPVHGEAQRRGESIRRILQIARALSSTAPLDKLLEQVVDGVIDFSGAERAFIVLVDDRGRIRIPVARDQERQAIRDPERQLSRRIVDDVLRRQTSLRFDNAMTDESLTSAASVVNLELRSVMCAPLLSGTRVFGLLYVDNRSKTGHFGDVDLDLLDIFAVQVAIALENARLVREFVRDEKLKVLGNLTGGVAHDFNNILSAILGRAQGLVGRSEDPAVAAGLRTIEKAARDGAVIVRRLQDFARVRKETGFGDVEVAGLVDDVIEFTRSRWEGAALGSGAQITVERDVPPGLVVKGHPAELREVLTNIVLNAIAAMPDGGTLSLSAQPVQQKVAIVVQDSGVGMSEEVRENIFDPYFTTRGGEGMGLGMSIVYGIVARHQGTVRVESALGKGTKVLVELPRGEQAPSEGARKGRIRSSHRMRRVVVVEDEPAVRAVMRDILRGAGLDVVEVPGGREALAAIESRGADVVLSDLGMMPMNGWEVARAVKDLDPTTSMILVTGWGAEIEPEVARRMHVDFLLRKPFDLERLVGVVDEAVDLADSRRDAARAARPADG